MLAMQLLQSNESTVPVLKFEPHITAVHSSFEDGISDYDWVYSTQNGNKYTLVANKSLTQFNGFKSNRSEKLFKILKSKVQDLIIDFDEEFDYFDFLFDLHESDEYDDFLVFAQKKKDLNVCNAISIFLSQREYENISSEEENYILAMLASNEVQLQEFALAAILNWDNFSNLDLLRAIEIQNKYLQEDLEDFIQSKV